MEEGRDEVGEGRCVVEERRKGWNGVGERRGGCGREGEGVEE